MNNPKHPFKTFSRNPTQSGLRSLRRSVVSTTVHATAPSRRSESRSQYPDFQSWSVLERRCSADRRACDGSSYLPSRVMRRAIEEITQVWDDGVHHGPSWPWRSVAWSVNQSVCITTDSTARMTKQVVTKALMDCQNMPLSLVGNLLLNTFLHLSNGLLHPRVDMV